MHKPTKNQTKQPLKIGLRKKIISPKKPQRATAALRKAMEADPSYAHCWHTILASCFSNALQVEIDDYQWSSKVGNDGASRFMKLCFKIETSEDMLDEEK